MRYQRQPITDSILNSQTKHIETIRSPVGLASSPSFRLEKVRNQMLKA